METYPLYSFLKSRPVVVLQRATGIRDLILVNLLTSWDWQCLFTKPNHSKHQNHMDLQPSSSSSLSLSSLEPSSSSLRIFSYVSPLSKHPHLSVQFSPLFLLWRRLRRYAYFHTFLHYLNTHIYPCSSVHSFYSGGVCGTSLTSTLALYKMKK